MMTIKTISVAQE